jgi:hypothetical protein
MLRLLAVHSNVIVVSLRKRKAILTFRWSPFRAIFNAFSAGG